MFGKYDTDGKLIPAAMELVRLAIPRRVYTQSHIDYVAEVIIDVFNQRKEIKGMKIIEEAPTLRHFTAKMQWFNNAEVSSSENHHSLQHKFKNHNHKIY
jgi:tryptophanase